MKFGHLLELTHENGACINKYSLMTLMQVSNCSVFKDENWLGNPQTSRIFLFSDPKMEFMGEPLNLRNPLQNDEIDSVTILKKSVFKAERYFEDFSENPSETHPG